jgi:hypothetical protein
MKPGDICILDEHIALCLNKISENVYRYLCSGEVIEIPNEHICPTCRCTKGRECLSGVHWFCWKCGSEGDF